MYPDQATTQTRQAGATLGSNRPTDPTPLSPVQAQLQRQRELLSELEGGANALIDPMRAALTHDPRESKGLNGAGSDAGQPPSCDLELVLLQANSALESSIQRLREIRNAIRL